ncbi:hypothetical protein BsWGS_16472 [Bradybaena similaris]
MPGSSAFCGGSPFWNESLLLKSSYPHFTECFQTTALVWVPCGVLWISTPMYLYYMSSEKQNLRIYPNKFNVFKTVLALLLMIISVINLVRLTKEDFPALYVASGVQIATFLLVAILIQVECYFGFVTSGVLFVTFLLLVVAGVVPFYSKIIEQEWKKERKKSQAINASKRLQPLSSSGYHRAKHESSERSPLLEIDSVEFSRTKDDNIKLSQPSLIRVISKVYGGSILISQLLKLVADLLTFVTPMLIDNLITFTQNRKTEQEWKGYVLACSFFVVAMLKTCVYQYHFHISMTLGMRIKNAVIAAVYKKALTISNEAKKESTVGEIVNLMSVDCQRIQDATGYIYMLWSMPLMIVLALYMLWGTLGPSSMAGLGVLLLLMPLNAWAAYKQRAYQMQQMKTKDERIKIMNEVLNGIKVLKLYAWEESFQNKITEIRSQELITLKKTAYLVAVTMFVWTCAPYVVQLVSFGTYIAVSDIGYLDPATAFVSFTLFSILNQPMTFLPMVIPFLIQAGVSVGRVSKFLHSQDLDGSVVYHDPDSEMAVKIENGTFTWDKALLLPTLRNINVSIPPGSLTAVVGTVGSGKSSLLSAMLGEMEKLEGRVTLKDAIAYVPQEAWIQNASLRDNIIFGNSFSNSQYRKVIQACALQPDIEILPAQDATEIGEKGINLSGGQKQRVSLARAVYSGADTYLLDDPLSAVDSHVGKHIFTEVLGSKGLLKNKTRVLVTHGIHWLPMVDHIIVMTNGQISETGSYDELMSHDGAFASFLKEYFRKEAETDVNEESDEDPDIQAMKSRVLQRLESVTSDVASSGKERDGSESDVGTKDARLRHTPLHKSLMKSTQEEKQQLTSPEKLIEDEKAETGNVKYSIYMQYIRAVGLWTFLLMSLVFLLFQAASTGSAVWLSSWTDDKLLANTSLAGSPEFVDRNNLYLAVYGVLGFVQCIFVLIFALISTTQMVKAAGILHFNLLDNILKAPMSFFDTTPIGRIVNRFSRDIETVDNNLPTTIRTLYQCVFSVLGTIVTIAYSTPIFLAVIVPLGIMYWLIQRFYIPTSRQLRRIESTTRSPIYVHFSETVSGAASIRAYGVQDRFVEESKLRVDNNLSFYFASIVANRWLGWYLEFIGNLIILAAALFAVLSTDLEAGLVGLSVSYASQVTGSLNYLVRMFSDLETNIVSVERIQEYTETPTEDVRINPNYRPQPEWPDHGEIIFKEYMTRYRPGLELVLKGVTCHITGQQKVGIVGRTGAGKSSLTLALFRLIEAAGGNIIIDGKTIADIGLQDLRSRLTILPQDPVIFSGTLRMNLDPFNEHTDTALWSALEHAHLKSFVEGLPAKLSYECGEGGQNLSVGQRQLVCLARTLVRKTKILVLDEATAAVDMETDDLIQKTIRTEFKDCTVITIAHRLNTIMDYDKIMVMDKGRVSEFDSPQVLLANRSSIFYQMARDAGLV